jgi:hypothetical protein
MNPHKFTRGKTLRHKLTLTGLIWVKKDMVKELFLSKACQSYARKSKLKEQIVQKLSEEFVA